MKSAHPHGIEAARLRLPAAASGPPCGARSETDVASVNGQAVYAAAAQRSPFAIAIPLHLMNTRTELDDFPWPYFPAIRSTIATAICLSPINQALLRDKLDKSRINGLGNITFKIARYRRRTRQCNSLRLALDQYGSFKNAVFLRQRV